MSPDCWLFFLFLKFLFVMQLTKIWLIDRIHFKEAPISKMEVLTKHVASRW